MNGFFYGADSRVFLNFISRNVHDPLSILSDVWGRSRSEDRSFGQCLGIVSRVDQALYKSAVSSYCWTGLSFFYINSFAEE